MAEDVARFAAGLATIQDELAGLSRAAQQHGHSTALAVPQLGPCASSGRPLRLWAARHSQGEAGPLGTQPLPRVLEPAASKAADFTAFDRTGAEQGCRGGEDALYGGHGLQP
eukprot:scaffold101818_cov45-Phaeocystis_antarctica.AAC.1